MHLAIDRINLGRIEYEPAYTQQTETHARILAARDANEPHVGTILIVEHEPVVTRSRKAAASDHLLSNPDLLAQQGIAVAETDRGGDITYHGPGQLVLYPIIDLQRLGIRLHDYLRILEDSVMETIRAYGVTGHRDPDATGVWVEPTDHGGVGPAAKVCAIGVRVRKWITLHGLALNITTDLSHFAHIVPCGLHGRPVTTLESLLGDGTPAMPDVADRLCDVLTRRAMEHKAG